MRSTTCSRPCRPTTDPLRDTVKRSVGTPQEPARARGSGFPPGFLWGAATSSYQVEGRNERSDWWSWEQQPGRIVGGDTSGEGADWWRGRAEEDFSRAAASGHNAHRLSLEWARLEPAPGRYDRAAFARYREILEAAKAASLAVSLTLQHFTVPQWLAARGGWTWAGVVERFSAYAARCVEAFSDVVDYWATLNEPTVLAQGGYLGTRWPPGSGSFAAYRAALVNMLRAHREGYRAIKAVRAQAQVGLVLAMPRYEPKRAVWRDRAAARLHDWVFNGNVLTALADELLLPPLALRPRRLEGLSQSYDWLGLNYYGRYRVRFAPLAFGAAFGRHEQTDSIRTATSDWGEVHPEGLIHQLRRLAALGVPLYVTENGVFEDRPGRQVEYLDAHLEASRRALDEGIDVRGYFWWTLVDNFEWAEGWGTPFGMFALDRATQRRSPRPVAALFEAWAKGRPPRR